jgi:hypothetical protein
MERVRVERRHHAAAAELSGRDEALTDLEDASLPTALVEPRHVAQDEVRPEVAAD